MINITYGGKSIRLLEPEAVEKLKHILSAKQLTYIEDLENNSLILLPALEGKTIIIKTLVDDQELLNLAQQLKQKLETSGANIIIDQQGKVKRGVLKLLDDQIVFCLNKNTSKEEKVLFYTSLFRGSHCNNIVRNIIRQFIKIAFTKVNFNIANLLQILTRVSYWPYLVFTPLPTILIEFSSAEVIRSLGENLSEWLLNSFVNCYGKTYTADDNLIISELLEEVDKNYQEQKIQEEEKQEQIKRMEEINENIKELLEAVRLTEEMIVNKNVPPEKPLSLKTKEKANRPVKKQTRTKAASPSKNSPTINTLLLNPGKYPLAPSIDGPVYQFARPGSNNYSVPLPVTASLKEYTKTSTCQPSIVTKSLFYEYIQPNTKKDQTENMIEDQDKKETDLKSNLNDEDIIKDKESLEEDNKTSEENSAETETNSLNFASILQDFKQPELAMEEQNLP